MLCAMAIMDYQSSYVIGASIVILGRALEERGDANEESKEAYIRNGAVPLSSPLSSLKGKLHRCYTSKTVNRS